VSRFQQVTSAIEQGMGRPHLKKYLDLLQNCDNIPRKKAKFEVGASGCFQKLFDLHGLPLQNFVKNALKLYDAKICTEIWDLISSHAQKVKECFICEIHATYAL
jgi:hypothetical protein